MTVGDGDAITSLAAIYEQTMGSGGLYLFYVGAFMVLYSTLFVSSASNARLFADVGGLAGVFRYRSVDDRMRVVRVAVFAIPIVVMLVYVQFESLVTLVLIGGVAQAMMLPFLAGAALYFHHRHSPIGLRASRTGTVLLWVAFVAMSSVGIFQAWRLVG
jgi:hypothetical protein